MSEQNFDTQQVIPQDENEELDVFTILKICFAVFIRNWKWFLLSVLVCLILAFVVLKKQSRVYSREATILIESSENNKYSNNSTLNALKQLNGVQVTDNLKNEIFILQSRRLMSMVVDQMSLDVEYTLMKGLEPVTLYETLPFEVEFRSPYVDDVAIDFELMPSQQLRIVKMTIGKERVDFDKVVSYGKSFDSPAGEICITRKVTDPEYLGKIVHVTRIDKEKVVTHFRKVVTASEINKDASLITLTCKDTNAKRAEAILSTLMDIYKRDIVESKNSIATNTANFVDKRIELIGAELSEVENKLAQFKQNNRIVDFTENARNYLQQSSMSQQELYKAQSELSVANFLRDHVSSITNNRTLIPDLGDMGNTGMQSQIVKYNEMVLQYTRLSENSSNESSVIQDQIKQLESMREVIKISLNNYVKTLQLQVDKIKSVENSYQTAMVGIPQKEIQALDITRQQAIKGELYTYLLNKREEVALQLAINEANIRVVEFPYGDARPVSPKVPIVLFIAFLIGLAIPALIIWLLIQMDTNVRGRKDVEDVMTAPILGDIPEWSDENNVKKMLTKDDNGKSISEAFRVLRYNLNFVLKEGGVIMMMEYITLAGFILAVFGTGVAVGKLVEKIERLDRKREDEEHKNTSKNDRR